MKNLIIIGAGDWGLEPFSWLKSAKGYGMEWKFKGFLDNNLDALKNIPNCDYSVLGNENNYEILSDDVFVCAIANATTKNGIVSVIKQRGGKFINLIHSNVLFFNNVTIGEGCIISPNCIFSNNAHVGNHSSINLACTIGHDVKIGDFCQISSQCDLTGHVKLGDCVFLGSSVCIIPKVKVGNNVNIGAGSVVIRSVKDDQSVFGNPAKSIM